MEIHFEKVTSDNRKAVENLQVFAEQQTFIESMAENLKNQTNFQNGNRQVFMTAIN